MANSESSLTEFANKCNSIHALEKNRTILEFLCVLAPQKSNKILTAVVMQDRTEIEHTRILSNVIALMKTYENLSSVDIPLPRSLVLGKSERFPECSVDLDIKHTYLSYLFTKDRESHKNMAILKVQQLEQLPAEVEIDYVKGFVVTLYEREELNRTNTLISQLSNETCILDLEFVNFKVTNSDMKMLLGNLQARNITIFSIKGNGVVAFASEILRQQPKLELLSINDTNTLTATESHHIESLCQEANRSTNLVELRLCGSVLDSSITTLSKRIKVTVCSKHNGMAKFIKVSKHAASSPSNIAEVDLSFSNLNSDLAKPGELIGQILIYLKTLIILRLRSCGLTSKDILQIEKKVLSSPSAIQELDLLGNKLNYCNDVQGILDCCPNLKVLLLTFINESEIPKRLGQTKVIVATGTEQRKTVLKFTESIHLLQKLYIIYAFPDFTKVNMSNGSCQLKILYILDAPDQDKALAALAKYVKYMKKLEELHFTSVNPRFLENFTNVLSLVTDLPPSLTHLDLYGYESINLIDILQEKHQMKNLLKLNIGSIETSPDTIQIIRQELQEINQKVEVYCDKEECLMSLISYSTVTPPSTVTMQSVQDAFDLLEVLH